MDKKKYMIVFRRPNGTQHETGTFHSAHVLHFVKTLVGYGYTVYQVSQLLPLPK